MQPLLLKRKHIGISYTAKEDELGRERPDPGQTLQHVDRSLAAERAQVPAVEFAIDGSDAKRA